MSQLLVLYMGSLTFRSIGIAVFAGISLWKVRNVALRHAVWVAVLGTMLLMPAFDDLLPGTWVPDRIEKISAKEMVTIQAISMNSAVVPRSFAQTNTVSEAPPVRIRHWDWWKGAAMLYALVAFAMYIRFVMGYRKIGKLQRTGRTITCAVWEEIAGLHALRWRTPILRESEAVQVPMTIGFFKPVVILPGDWQTWDNWKLGAVLMHEFTHVRRGDWSIAVVAAAAKCAFWINPLSWFLERQLSELAEQSSDDASIAWTRNTTRYAEVLLEFAEAAQHGGRFMKRGVAMARHKMRARIERVLTNRQSGVGVLHIAGWILVLLLAAPVLYSASALHVASGRATAPAPQFAAIFNPQYSYPLRVVSQQQAPTAVVSGAGPRLAANLQDLFKLELQAKPMPQQTPLQSESVRQPEDQTKPTPAVVPSDGTVSLSQDANLAIQEIEILRQQQNNPSNSTQALLNLPDNPDDLLAYLTQLARLRSGKTFSVSFTGIQGRTISMKVAEHNFSFGCESCAFFVGDSVVSSTPTTPGPGIQVQLSPDGNELAITCRSSICEVNALGESASQAEMRQLLSGASESIRTSIRISVVISKY